MPEIAQPRRGPGQRIAIRRMRDRPVDNPPDPCIGEDRHALESLFQPGRDAVYIALEKLILAVPFGKPPRLAQASFAPKCS